MVYTTCASKKRTRPVKNARLDLNIRATSPPSDRISPTVIQRVKDGFAVGVRNESKAIAMTRSVEIGLK